MSRLLLVPYNSSMRLGQGYNSFLQTPCIDKAVQIDSEDVVKVIGGPQIVSYSSRLVRRISDVARSMNISSAAAIKSGFLEVPGHHVSIDDVKFAESDFNAVVSVRVVNQSTESRDNITFKKPSSNVVPTGDSTTFQEIYGDSFISGFIEGGDLHGIVSIKVLEDCKKEEIHKLLKGKLNSASSSNPPGGDFQAALSHTETTITMSWSGGGQIKPPNEEWTLESLFRAAAGFPANVEKCPKHTWAVLTRYDNNSSFVEWAATAQIKVPRFDNVYRYTSDLLHMYMAYKLNVGFLQDVISMPGEYEVSSAGLDPVKITVEALLAEKKAMKKEMQFIVRQIDILNLNPEGLDGVESRSTIKCPELWATRLPILKRNARPGNGTVSGDSLANIQSRVGPVVVPKGVPRNPRAGGGSLNKETLNQSGKTQSQGGQWEEKLYPHLPAWPRSYLPVGLSALYVPRDTNVRVRCFAENITKDSCTMNLSAWGDSYFQAGTCRWLQIAADDRAFQFGRVETAHGGSQVSTKSDIYFPYAYTTTPKVVVWLSKIDMQHSRRWCVKTAASSITKTGFTIHIDTWGGHFLNGTQVTWVAYPADRLGIASGSLSTLDMRQTENSHPGDKHVRLNFDSKVGFSATPRVFTAINMLDIGSSEGLQIEAQCIGTSTSETTVKLEIWGNDPENVAGVSYIALTDV